MVISNKKLTALILSSSVFTITGCTQFQIDTHEDIKYTSEYANKLVHENSKADPYSPVSISNNLWLGPFSWGDSTSLRPKELMSTLSYSYTTPQYIEEALATLARDSGAQISLDESAKKFLGILEESGTASVEPELRPVQKTSPTGELVTIMEPISPTKTADAAQGDDEKVIVEFLLNGRYTFEEWLNKLTLELGLFWDYSYIGDRPFISISGTVHEDIQFEGLLQGIGSQNSNVAASWDELSEFVKKSLTPIGQASFSASTGRIYISDRPDVVNKIKRRVEYENAVFSSQIHYNIKIVTVDLSEYENYQGGLNAVYESLNNSFSLNNGVALGAGVQMAYANTNPTSNFNGSGAEISLNNNLSKKASIRDYTFFSRNRTSVSQVYRDRESYVRSIATNNTDNATIVTPEVDKLNEGFEIQFLGTILSGNRIALDLTFSQDYVKGRSQESYSGNMITLPKENNTAVLNKFFVESGQSFVLSDSSINNETSNYGPSRKLGILEWIFGASTSTTKTNSIRFFIVTPTIVSPKRG